MIKVVTFNLRCFDDPYGNSIDERAPRLKEVLAKYDPDLVGFQEVTPRWLEHLTAYYSEEYEIINKWRKHNNQESTPLMWKKERFDCLDHGHFWLSDIPHIESTGWDTMGCNRICMWTKLRDKQSGETFTFFNTHYGFGDDCQIKSGKLLLTHMKEMGGPCILTADFNMNANSVGYKTLTDELIDCNVATINYQKCTFHSYHPENKNDGPIDFCFMTKDLISAKDAVVIDDKVDDLFPSDHFGLCFELKVHQMLSLLTLNVEKDGAPASPEDRARMVRDILRRYGADVVGLQEVTPTFEERIKEIGRYGWALKYATDEKKEAAPILWDRRRFDLLHEDHIPLYETSDQLATMVVLQEKDSNRRFCCINSRFERGDEGDKEAVKRIAEKAAAYGDIPVFCIGDFNMVIGSDGHKAMREQFRDTRFDIAPRDYTPTFNGHGDEFCRPDIMDFIFYNGVEARPLSYKVIDEQPWGEYISDHNGIYATFILE